MEKLFIKLSKKYKKEKKNFIIHRDYKISFKDLFEKNSNILKDISEGSVVAIIGDFSASTINILIRLIDLKTIIIPLTKENRPNHEYFFEQASVDYVIENNKITKLKNPKKNSLLEKFRLTKSPGIVFFSSGTTGRPKAILHDLNIFLKRYSEPRPAYKTLNFLLFDHIGGLNTLFHTLFNKGQVVIPYARTVSEIINDIEKYKVELLPTTPTFLRMLVMDDELNTKRLKSLKVITYGSEMMDENTLLRLNKILPNVKFKQTYGMSEISILRVKSENNKSLWIKIDSDELEIKISRKVLFIRSKIKMFGYLNNKSPFDKNGWYNTNDLVEKKGQFIKIVGRSKQIISIGGLKILPSEIERIALQHPLIKDVKAKGVSNPITGQHIEIVCEPKKKVKPDIFRQKLRSHFDLNLDPAIKPIKIIIKKIEISHRFKKQ
ncbi:fatty acid--CoA ligase family protein [bacterium]|nr:fatty acid--CoA ligase family protein [bacterium]